MITRSEQSQTQAYLDHQADVAADYVPMARRHAPTPEQIAVRDELAEIGNFDTYDATRIVMGRLAIIDQRIFEGVSAEQIAIDITLTSIGLTAEEAEFVQSRAKTAGHSVREAVREFHYHTDYDALRADMANA